MAAHGREGTLTPMTNSPLLALVVICAPLSLLAIGGASSIYAPLQHQTVDVYHWFTGREFVELFAIARLTPGPGSMLTCLIGWRVAGFAGALVATLALYVPSCTLCFFVARAWNRYRGTRWHAAVENGLRPIAAGLMMSGGVMILRVEDTGPLAWAIALAAALWLTWRPLEHPLALMAGGAAIFVAAHAVIA
jgi:chromate transporter